MKIQTQKQKRLFTALIIGLLLFVLIGLLFITVLSKENKELITTTITSFMVQVKKGNLTYPNALFQSIARNGGEGVLLFFLGMSIIGIPITIYLFFSHAFLLGFSISSIFYVYKWKGILIAIIYVFPQILNLCIFLVFSYFSLLFSKYLFYLLFLKKDISLKKIMNRYVKVFGISLCLLMISSVIEVFLVPKILSFLL